MKPDVSVTVPTLLRDIPSLVRLAHSLEKQSLPSFETILITPLGIDLEPLRAGLQDIAIDYRVVRQSRKGMENAMNVAVREGGGVNINTDDDAVLQPTHVEKCVKALSQGRVGLITGWVNGRPPNLNWGLISPVTSWTLSPTPLIVSSDRGSASFQNRCGLPAVRPSALPRMLGARARTFLPIGVNMAWLRDAMAGPGIWEYSILGTLNESRMAEQAVANGYQVWLTRDLNVSHIHNPSALSRREGRRWDTIKVIEFFISPVASVFRKEIHSENIDRALCRLSRIPLPMWYRSLASATLSRAAVGLAEQWDVSKLSGCYEELVRHNAGPEQGLSS